MAYESSRANWSSHGSIDIFRLTYHAEAQLKGFVVLGS